MIRKVYKETQRLEKKIGKKLGCQFGITEINISFDGDVKDSFVSMKICWNWSGKEDGWHNGEVNIIAKNMNINFLSGYILAQIEYAEINDETK